MARKAERSGSAWPVMVSALLLSGAVAAVVSVSVLRLAAPEPPPRVAVVRLAGITAAWTARAAEDGASVEDVRAWGAALETTLDRMAERHRLVLLPARAVAAGAPDVTPWVEGTLEEILALGEGTRSRGVGQ